MAFLFLFFLIFGIGDQRVCVYVFDAHYKHSSGAPKHNGRLKLKKKSSEIPFLFLEHQTYNYQYINNGVWNFRLSSEISPIQAKWQILLQNSVPRKFQSQLLFKNLLRRIGRRRSLRLGVPARYAYSPIFRWPNSSSYSSSFLLFRFPQKTAQETFQISLSSSHLLQFQEEIRSVVSAACF